MPQPVLFGIVNITEDSFSDGGRYLDPAAAIAHARALVAAGADVIDLGAAASNPAAAPVDAAEEIRRLDPVMTALAADRTPVSIDSFTPQVQRFAIARGAAYLNDIQGFPEPALYPELAAARCRLVVMHADEPAARRGQFGIERGLGETLDIVEIGGAAGDREALHLRREAVDRDRRAVGGERRHDRIEPADFLGRIDRRRSGVAGGGAEIDDVGAGGDEGAGMGDGGGRVEIAPAVGEGIFGDVDDAEKDRLRHGSERTAQLEDGADAFRVRIDVELFDPYAHPLDPRIAQAGGADPLGKALAQSDMPGAGDLPDRGDDPVIIDDAAAILPRPHGGGRGGPGDSLDGNPDPLLFLALLGGDADAGKHDEPAHGHGIARPLPGRHGGLFPALHSLPQCSSLAVRDNPGGAPARPGRAADTGAARVIPSVRPPRTSRPAAAPNDRGSSAAPVAAPARNAPAPIPSDSRSSARSRPAIPIPRPAAPARSPAATAAAGLAHNIAQRPAPRRPERPRPRRLRRCAAAWQGPKRSFQFSLRVSYFRY